MMTSFTGLTSTKVQDPRKIILPWPKSSNFLTCSGCHLLTVLGRYHTLIFSIILSHYRTIRSDIWPPLSVCNSIQSHRNFRPGPSESNPLVQLTWHCLRQLFLLLPPYHEYLGSIQATTRRANMVLEIVIAISILNRKFSLVLLFLKSLVILSLPRSGLVTLNW